MNSDREEVFVQQLRSVTGGENSSIGDDCAVLQDVEPTLLATVDSMVSRVHFTPDASVDDRARKLVGINLSDIAAMGGQPRWALLSSVSAGPIDRQTELAESVAEHLGNVDVDLVGGDISRSPSGEDCLSLTLLGRPVDGDVLWRSAASPGDLIVVSGRIGLVKALLETEQSPDGSLRDRLYNPPDRLALGQEAVRKGIRCAIDLSDGFVKDLNRVCEASGVGATLDYRELPIHPRTRELASSSEEALQWALDGGEDFELLFAIPPGRLEQIETEVELSVVGSFTGERSLRWDPALPEGIDSENLGYDHFD